MEFLTDLRYGFRNLRRNPGFTAVAVLTLALGLGANGAVFSIVETVLARPLPFQKPERLVKIWEVFAKQDEHKKFRLSEVEFLDVREQNGGVFSDVAAYSTDFVSLTGAGEPEQLLVARVSPNLFDLLGIRAALGGTFSWQGEPSGTGQVVVLGQDFWKRRFGADPGVIGRALQLNGESHLVAGVMPAGFQFPGRSEAGGTLDLWISQRFDRATLPAARWGGAGRYLDVIARLAPGISLDRARAAMEASAQTFRAQFPESYTADSGFGLSTDSLLETQIAEVRPALLALLAAGLLVLLIGCVNVANLLLIRSHRRGRELAIRTAVGASRRRLVRQFLAEGLLLSILGAVLGLLLAFWGLRGLASLIPIDIPRSENIALDVRSAGFTLLLSLLAGILAGLTPVLQLTGRDLFAKLKDGTGRSSEGIKGRRFRSGLVIAEVAVALVVLVGAGLLIRNFMLLLRVNPGFEPDHVLTMKISLPEAKYDTARIFGFHRELLDRVRALPRVERVGLVSQLPLGGTNSSHGITVEGAAAETYGMAHEVDFRSASPDYFQALRIPLIAGRSFADTDVENAPGVVVVDELLARRYWAGTSPLGKRLKQGRPDSKRPWLTVIGVVRHVKHGGVDKDSDREQIYYSCYQRPGQVMSLVVRTASSNPLSLAGSVRTQVLQIDPGQPVAAVRSMRDWYAESLAKPRFSMLLLSLFAAVSLLLVVVGTYGVIATSTLERTHEIGIRMALGAQRRSVLDLVVRHSLGLALLGVGIGLAAALLSTRLLASQIHQMSVTDPLTFAGVSLLLVAVVLAASFLPAYRATRIDPILALRRQ